MYLIKSNNLIIINEFLAFKYNPYFSFNHTIFKKKNKYIINRFLYLKLKISWFYNNKKLDNDETFYLYSSVHELNFKTDNYLKEFINLSDLDKKKLKNYLDNYENLSKKELKNIKKFLSLFDEFLNKKEFSNNDLIKSKNIQEKINNICKEQINKIKF